MRHWVLITTLLFAGVLAWTVLKWRNQPVEVVAVQVGERAIDEYIETKARTRLPRRYRITMPFDGRLQPCEVNVGDGVNQGQLLAQIAEVDVQHAVDRARAALRRVEAEIGQNQDSSVESTQLEQALESVKAMDHAVESAKREIDARKAQLDLAEQTVHRMRKLEQSAAVARQQLDEAESRYQEASASYARDQQHHLALQSARAAVAFRPTELRQQIARRQLHAKVLQAMRAEAQVTLDETLRRKELSQMHSPIRGVVLAKTVRNDRFVPAGTELFVVGCLEGLEVEAEILSQDVAKLRPDMPAEIYGPSIGLLPIEGRVSHIDPVAFTKVGNLGDEEQRVKVVVSAPRSKIVELLADRNLGVGYTVRVRIIIQRKPKTLVLPRSSVFRGPGGDWFAFVIREGRARLCSVNIGLKNEDDIEVKAGVSAGALVIVAPKTDTVDGTRVKPITSEATPHATSR